MRRPIRLHNRTSALVRVSWAAIRAKGAITPGYLEAVSAALVESNERHVLLSRESYEALRAQFSGARPSGPGTELKSLLAKFGIHASPTCKCNAMARKMDAWGEESLDHIEEIVDVMEETAKKRGLPFLRTAGRLLVRKAVRNWRWKATGK